MRDLAPLVAVVDDDESVRISISSLLRSYGYEVRTFPAADDFLNFDAAANWTCIVCDIHMPSMDGFDLASAYKDAGGLSPIIFITAFYDDKVAARARAAGAQAIMRKPFDCQAFVDAIGKAGGRD